MAKASPNPKPTSARRREAIRELAREDRNWLSRFRRKDVFWAMLFVVAFTVIAGSIAVATRQRPKYRLGEVVERTVVARASMSVLDYEQMREKAEFISEGEPAIYRVNSQLRSELRQTLLDLYKTVATHERFEDLTVSAEEVFGLQPDSFAQLRTMVGEQGEAKWRERVDAILTESMRLPVIDRREQKARLPKTGGPADAIALAEPCREYPYESVMDFDNERDRQKLRTRLQTKVSLRLPGAAFNELRGLLVSLIMSESEGKPFLVLDEQLTEQRREQVFNQALSDPGNRKYVQYSINDVLIPVGAEITPERLALLETEQDEYYAQLGPTNVWLIRGGVLGLVFVITVGLWLYVATYTPRLIENPVRGFALASLLILCQGVAVLTAWVGPGFHYFLPVLPPLVCAIVLAIVYDQRFALAAGTMHALLVTVSLDQPVGFLVVTVTGVAVAVRQLPDVRSRAKLIWVGLWTGLAVAIAVLMVSFLERSFMISGQWGRIGWDVGAGFLAAFATGLLVQGLLPAIEAVFKVTTSMTLKELNDASHPLLRRLAEAAPGTYQHSLRLADLAESAAESIGAHALMCKVGAMYHDIGKINKPGYFIENQSEGPNRHEKLSPAMSVLIIVGHVKDGIEMAREYNLPRAVRHMIESHHGTTLVEYFYHAARQQSEVENTSAPSEFEFRYPGPKPQTKEAGILMLCDGIESAARTVADPTPIRLEQLVHKMAQKRLMDGQFDECNLTLKELHRIEQAIHKTLCAIYHARVVYPKGEEAERVKPESASITGTAS